MKSHNATAEAITEIYKKIEEDNERIFVGHQIGINVRSCLNAVDLGIVQLNAIMR